MPYTHLLFRDQARQRILAGATALADALRLTLGAALEKREHDRAGWNSVLRESPQPIAISQRISWASSSPAFP